MTREKSLRRPFWGFFRNPMVVILMNCDAVRNLLSAYVDREVSFEDERRIRLHLLDCPSCAQEEKALRQMRELLSSLPLQELPEDFWFQLRAKLVAPGIHMSRNATAEKAFSPLRRLQEKLVTLALGAFQGPGPERPKRILPWLALFMPFAFAILVVLITANVNPSREAGPTDLVGSYFREHVASYDSRPLADRSPVTYISQKGSRRSEGFRDLPPSLFREPFSAAFVDSRPGAWGE